MDREDIQRDSHVWAQSKDVSQDDETPSAWTRGPVWGLAQRLFTVPSAGGGANASLSISRGQRWTILMVNY